MNAVLMVAMAFALVISAWAPAAAPSGVALPQDCPNGMSGGGPTPC